MDRVRQAALACDAALAGTYRDKVQVLRAIAPRVGHAFVGIALCDFVARQGLEDPDFSLEALRDLTPYGSAEFAVRPFLVRDLTGTVRTLTRWAEDENEHVRRLASEGSRPRLPWGLRLAALVQDPEPTGPILDRLQDDPSLYVRKSVANHLNDIAKDHPDRVIARVSAWDRDRPGTAWIVRHALRTLVKRGDARALKSVGSHRPPGGGGSRLLRPPQKTPARGGAGIADHVPFDRSEGPKSGCGLCHSLCEGQRRHLGQGVQVDPRGACSWRGGVPRQASGDKGLFHASAPCRCSSGRTSNQWTAPGGNLVCIAPSLSAPTPGRPPARGRSERTANAG